MPFADKKTWEKVRPLACHGSGIGKACDAWSSACKPPERIASDTGKVSDALKAIDQMDKALKKAEGKAKKVSDKKARGKVLSLIEEWRAEITKYHGQLSGHVILASEQAQEDQKQAFLNAFQEFVDGTLDWMKNVVTPQMADINKALKAGDAGEVDRKLRSVEHSMQDGQRVAEEPQIPFKNILKKYKEIPKDSVKLRDVDGMLTPVRKMYRKQRALLDQLQEAAKDLISGDAPQDSKFRKRFLDAEAGMKKAIATLKSSARDMKAIGSRAQKAAAQIDKLKAQDPQKVLALADAIITSMREVEKVAAKAIIGDTIPAGNLVGDRNFHDDKAKAALNKMLDDHKKANQPYTAAVRACRENVIQILENLEADPAEIQRRLKLVKYT